MTTTFAYVDAERTAYEFPGGFSQGAKSFMLGVQARVGVPWADIEFFTASDRDRAADLLDAYVRGRGVGVTVVKVDA